MRKNVSTREYHPWVRCAAIYAFPSVPVPYDNVVSFPTRRCTLISRARHSPLSTQALRSHSPLASRQPSSPPLRESRSNGPYSNRSYLNQSSHAFLYLSVFLLVLRRVFRCVWELPGQDQAPPSERVGNQCAAWVRTHGSSNATWRAITRKRLL